MTASYTYHPLNADFRLQSITHTLPDSVPVNQFGYGYDAHGRITSWSIQDGALPAANYTAGYDNADRLTSFTSTAHQYGYGYDAADNRLTETIDGATATAHCNSLNEMMAVNSANSPPARTLGWDAENRLVSIDYTGTGMRSEFTFDGNNRCVRIVEKNGASVTADRRYIWHGLSRCEERDASGATVVRRFFPEGEQIGGQSFYYARDHLGSVRQVTDGAGVIRARYDYDPYGRRTKLSGDVDATFGFTGHLAHDPSGLALAPFRVYDPRIGRWLSRDPIAERGGTNLFAYVADNPVQFRDRLGYSPFDCFLVNVLTTAVTMADRAVDDASRKLNVIQDREPLEQEALPGKFKETMDANLKLQQKDFQSKIDPGGTSQTPGHPGYGLQQAFDLLPSTPDSRVRYKTHDQWAKDYGPAYDEWRRLVDLRWYLADRLVEARERCKCPK